MPPEMSRPQIPLEAIRHIEELWAMNPSQSAVQIRIKYLQYSNAHQIGNRKVQMIIANARQVNQRYMAFLIADSRNVGIPGLTNVFSAL